jgi:hypothetical protein
MMRLSIYSSSRLAAFSFLFRKTREARELREHDQCHTSSFLLSFSFLKYLEHYTVASVLLKIVQWAIINQWFSLIPQANADFSLITTFFLTTPNATEIKCFWFKLCQEIVDLILIVTYKITISILKVMFITSSCFSYFFAIWVTDDMRNKTYCLNFHF